MPVSYESAECIPRSNIFRMKFPMRIVRNAIQWFISAKFIHFCGKQRWEYGLVRTYNADNQQQQKYFIDFVLCCTHIGKSF